MLARYPIIPGTYKPFKTIIVFSLDEGLGMLYKAPAVFSMRDINLTKMESRPRRKRPLLQSVGNNDGSKHFDYLFYRDFEASMADYNAQNALKHLKEFATFFRVLGSYPMVKNLKHIVELNLSGCKMSYLHIRFGEVRAINQSVMIENQSQMEISGLNG